MIEAERVGIYRIESLLGRGGMGEVFLAWDEILERHVAIKRVLPEAAADSPHRQRFLREARAVARLDHPAIVRIYHVLERQDGDCLVMEYVKGQDLAKVVAGGRVEMVQAILLARGIAEGLAEAHAIGLVHRDLKLANVMIQLGGGVKILDFGLAKSGDADLEEIARELSSPNAELTLPGTLLGTAFAMSPEQVRGEELDARSDLFSLGSLFYELLTASRPFQGKNFADTLKRVLEHEPPPIKEQVAGLPDELGELLGSLLAKNKEERPRSAQLVAERLTRMLDQLGAAARPAGPLAAFPGDAEATLADPQLPTAALPMGPKKMGAGLTKGVDLRTVASLATAGLDDSSRSALRRCARAIGRLFDAVEIGGAEVDFLFRRPAEAVAFALRVHEALAGQTPPLEIAIALHLGEVVLPGPNIEPRSENTAELLGRAHFLARHGRSRQTLLSRSVFDLARGARTPVELADMGVCWLAHGEYRILGEEAPIEICEVGRQGFAPLAEPASDNEL